MSKIEKSIKTRFADFIRGTPALRSGTSDDWIAWEKKARKKKFRYWLVEEFFYGVERAAILPSELLANVKNYFLNRVRNNTHALISKLPKGKWHDLDDRILHCLFDELVKYVEVDLAIVRTTWTENEGKKFIYPRFRLLEKWRSAEAGLDYLEWAASLRNDEEWLDKNHPDYLKETPQAQAAKETIALYKWWVEKRPQRPDPLDESGWSDICEKHSRENPGIYLLAKARNEEEEKERKEASDRMHSLSEKYYDEDSEMLCRLIKIRASLWI